MKPLRILHTNMHHQWGGQPNRILTTAAGLREHGHHVCIAAPRDAETIRRARAAGIATFDELELERGFAPLSLRRDVRAMRAHLRRERYDIIDTHGSQDSWVVRFALLAPGSGHIGLVRTRHNTFEIVKHPLNRWLYSRVDHVITISPQVIPLMKGLVPDSEFTAIYSAPDPEAFAAAAAVSRETVRAEFGFREADLVVGVVGRLAPEKGHAVLLDAAPAIAAAHPTVRFLFVGKGRSRPALVEHAARLGVGGRVTFAGFRRDVPRVHRAMDLFVLCPTAGESLGTSILEAFLSGLPVVATDVGGVRESVRDGVTGRLVPPGAPGALAAAINWSLSNLEEARAMAREGRRLVEREFTPGKIAEKTESVYARVLGKRRRAERGGERTARSSPDSAPPLHRA